MTIGDRIRKTRADMGISQVEFAEKINVSKQTLYKYENNLITNIPSDKIEAIAKIANISPAYLMGWYEEDPNIIKRDEELEDIETILISSGFTLCYDNYDDDLFCIKNSSGKTISILHDYELLPRYESFKKKGYVSAEMLISDSFTLYPEEKELLEAYQRLNDDGKQKVIDYTIDLSENPKYLKDTKEILMAAHNDKALEDGELEKMKSDIDMLDSLPDK